LNIEKLSIRNRVIDILIAKLSPHYDEVSLEAGLIEMDLDTGNEQPPDTRISVAILLDFVEK
jgi:hypothetical protein